MRRQTSGSLNLELAMFSRSIKMEGGHYFAILSCAPMDILQHFHLHWFCHRRKISTIKYQRLNFSFSTAHHLSIDLAAATHVDLVTVLVSNPDVPNLEALSVVLLSSEDVEDWIPHIDPIVHGSFSPVEPEYDVATQAVMEDCARFVYFAIHSTDMP